MVVGFVLYFLFCIVFAKTYDKKAERMDAWSLKVNITPEPEMQNPGSSRWFL